MVNWATVDPRAIQLRQPPGERNALGVIKFMFPNKYAVYLHDTPAKALFNNDYRAYSHGCMRVMNPWDFANVLLTQEAGWTVPRLKKLVGGPEKTRRFPEAHQRPHHLFHRLGGRFRRPPDSPPTSTPRPPRAAGPSACLRPIEP